MYIYIYIQFLNGKAGLNPDVFFFLRTSCLFSMLFSVLQKSFTSTLHDQGDDGLDTLLSDQLTRL